MDTKEIQSKNQSPHPGQGKIPRRTEVSLGLDDCRWLGPLRTRTDLLRWGDTQSKSRFWRARARPAEQKQWLEVESSALKPNSGIVRLCPCARTRLMVLRGPMTPVKGKKNKELQKRKPTSSWKIVFFTLGWLHKLVVHNFKRWKQKAKFYFMKEHVETLQYWNSNTGSFLSRGYNASSKENSDLEIRVSKEIGMYVFLFQTQIIPWEAENTNISFNSRILHSWEISSGFLGH